MCDPITLGIAQGGLSLIGSAAQVNAQNSASMANQQNALLAANDEYASNSQRYIEENRSLIQGSFDEILQGRSDAATAYTSALQSGVQGGSVKALLRDRRQKAARSAQRTSDEMSGLEQRTEAANVNVRARTQARINSVPRTSLNMGHLASAISPILRSQA